MSRESVREKAARYLNEGRIRVVTCAEDDATLLGDVRGEGVSYAVVCEEGSWSCDCRARSECCHIAAFKRVVCFEPRKTP